MLTNSPLTINTAEIDLAALQQSPGAQAFWRLHDGTLPPPIATQGDGVPVMAAGRGELEPQPPLSPQEQFDLMVMTYGLGSPELLRFVAAVKHVCSAAGTGGKGDHRFDLNKLAEAHSIASDRDANDVWKGASVDYPPNNKANKNDLASFRAAVLGVQNLLVTINDPRIVPQDFTESLEFFLNNNDTQLEGFLAALRQRQQTEIVRQSDVYLQDDLQDISIHVQRFLDFCRLISYALKVHQVDGSIASTVGRAQAGPRLRIAQTVIMPDLSAKKRTLPLSDQQKKRFLPSINTHRNLFTICADTGEVLLTNDAVRLPLDSPAWMLFFDRFSHCYPDACSKIIDFHQSVHRPSFVPFDTDRPLADLHAGSPTLLLPAQFGPSLREIRNRVGAVLAGHNVLPSSEVNITSIVDATKPSNTFGALEHFFGRGGENTLLLADWSRGVGNFPLLYSAAMILGIRLYIEHLLMGDCLMIAAQDVHPELNQCRTFDQLTGQITELRRKDTSSFNGLPNIQGSTLGMNHVTFERLLRASGLPKRLISVVMNVLELKKTSLRNCGVIFPEDSAL